MDVPPLSLSILRLTPHTLICDQGEAPLDPKPVPSTAFPTPNPPPRFSLSPTHNYPSPFGLISLGSTLSLHARLTNTRPDGGEVLGVKMMIEIQSPGGRYRLGEVVHAKKEVGEKTSTSGGEAVEDMGKLSALGIAEMVDMEVASEMKELGLHVLICSVAWETLDGRRTFQRFLKFNVNAPLAIKTRIQISQDPNTSLDPIRRTEVSLEVLVQNVSTEGILFDRVQLEAVHGLVSRPIGALITNTLMPSDTRQYLFVLSPAPSPIADLPKSVFPPIHLGGTILPLGRLDVAWFSGPYRHPGRLQTSTLNRRVPVAAIAPKALAVPTRTISAAPPSPAGGVRRAETPRVPPPLSAKVEEEDARWEFDLTATEVQRDGLEVENEFIIKLRLGIRDATPIDDEVEIDTAIPPRPSKLGIQYLTFPPPRPEVPPPTFALSTPTRSAAPLSPASSRPFSPLSPSTPAAGPTSRPMTPVSTQLRHAATQSITSPITPLFIPALAPPAPVVSSSVFPHRPFLTKEPTRHAKRLPSQAMLMGEVAHLGVSLTLLEPVDFRVVQEDTGTTYADPPTPPRRWEAVHEFQLRFIALQEGMAELGGMRVLIMDEEGSGGSIGREWDILGDVWVDG